ncbi:MAG: ATP-binding protein [Desulfovermiculus sp.]
MHSDQHTQTLDPRHMAVRVCLARLIVLTFLLIPLSLTWLVSSDQSGLLGLTSVFSYQIFLISGFSLTILFLLLPDRLSKRTAFFWVQLATDLVLVCYLVLITGGLKSNFAFIGLALLFLYGRTLGLKAAQALTLCLAGLYVSLIGVQTTFVPTLALNEAFLYGSLHLMALALMLLLVRMNIGGMHSLIQEMAKRDRQLRHSEFIKRKVMDWMPNGLVVVNAQGRISTINAQALVWAQAEDIEQAISCSLHLFFPGLYAAWTAWDGQEPVRKEFTHTDQLFGATLTKLPALQGTLILFTDITRIKELEHQVREMEKMATVGELAAGLAHEIKNPLSGIQASLQLLPSNSLPEEQRQRLYQVVERDVQRLNQLLTSFLAFARPKPANIQRVHLAETVQSCVYNLHTDYPQVHIQSTPELENKVWTWDPHQLHQVLLNLLMNAVQAASQNHAPWVAISWGTNDDCEYISIQDNGPGLDPKIADKLFDPFTTSKEQGSGLGLSIAQRLAHQNHSWITVSHAQGPQTGVTARIIASRQSLS